MMNQKLQGAGNLIKSDGRGKLAVEQPPSPSSSDRKIIKNQIVNARSEAAQILAEAESFAAATRLEAEEAAKNLREEAFREGQEAALAEFEQKLLEVRELRERVWRETEQDLLRLSVRLAEKILGREIKKDDKAIAGIVATALQNARQQEKLTVRVNPTDLPTVEKEIGNLAPTGRARFLDFIADPRVSSGGCLIESEVGTIDAQLETQLRVLERALVSQSEGENNFGF